MIEIKEFLDEYNTVDIQEGAPNFFEIAGFPHYENVFSNVFGFFAEKSITIVKALLECCQKEIDANDDQVIEVAREFYTESKNKIDIVIKTEKMIIGIENKIDAPLYNDTDDYYKCLHKMSREEKKELVCIILSKNKIQDIPENFHGILHYDIALSIKKYYSVLLNELTHRYFFLLSEFIENIESLHGGKYMNNEYIQIVKTGDNVEKINNIVTLAMKARKEYTNRANEVLEQFANDKIFPNKYVYGNRQGESDNIGYMSIIAVLEGCIITKSKYNITFDIKINHDGYKLYLFDREERNKKDFWDLLRKIIPDFDKEFKIVGTRAEQEPIPVEGCDRLIEKVKRYIDCFRDYKKSEKRDS